MVIQTRDKAMKYTYLALVLSAAVFAFIRDLNNEPMMDLCAAVCISVSVGQIYHFIKTKEYDNLIMAVITAIVAIFATIRFFLGH